MDNVESVLRDMLESVISNKFDRIHVSVPAIIENIDPATGFLSVRIVSGTKIDNKTVALPVIEGVPVVFPRSKTSGFVFEQTIGDEVLLVFCDVDISHYVETGVGRYPDSKRRFNMNDCYAIAGVSTAVTIPKLLEDESAKMYSGASEIVFKKTGSLLINNHLEVLP